MKTILEVRRALRRAIADIDTACWTLEKYGVTADPETMMRQHVDAATSILRSIDWTSLHELYRQHRASSTAIPNSQVG